MPPLDEGTPLFVQIAEQLADDIVDGVLAEGAREQLRAGRRKRFAEQYLDPMLAEAKRLGIDTDTLLSLIQGSSWHNGGNTP